MTTWKVCSRPGCPNLHDTTGMCAPCRATQDRTRRPHGNPYATPGHRTFREQVLTRDPICTECMATHSTVADHHPLERWELIEAGENPNDPKHGRGLCKPCHDRHTARTSPGGWNNPNG